MIPFRCDHCGKDLKVKDELAGKKVKCPDCGKPTAVPQLTVSLSPPPSGPREERMLPPRPEAAGEGRTVPPGKQSHADSGGHTALGDDRTVVVDEDARRRFEAAWRAGKPESIEKCLPDQATSCYLATLEELVQIEMEFQWKVWSESDERPVVPTVEKYLARFPLLNQPKIIQRLVEHEFGLRQRLGSRPSIDDYEKRFPGVRLGEVGAGPDVTSFLAPPERPDEIGRLGPFRVLKILGSGGMGVVYKAEDPQLERLVALKAMLPDLGGGEAARRRFLREAKAAAAIVHDHIVPIHQVGEDRGVPFIAMQFLEGEPLDERLKREGRLPIAEALCIGRETAEGLAAAHEKGLIHRDIKPANIWLERKVASGQWSVASKSDSSSSPPATDHSSRPTSYRVKILDFGLARPARDDTRLTQSGAIVGTPAYMAPEQAAGEPVDHRCDLFSLGCVLYRACTGEMPFKGKNTMAIISALAMDNPAPPCGLHDDIPQALSALIMHLLAKKREERPESAHVVVQALLEIEKSFSGEPKATKTGKLRAASTTQMPAGQKSGVRSEETGVRNRRWPWLVGGVLGLAGVGVALFFLTSRERPRPESDLPPTFTNSLGMEFVLVPKGKSWLGGGGGKPGDKEVEIKEDFYLGKYEVTQRQWEKVTGSNPSAFKAVPGIGKDDQTHFPVENVSWDDCQAFIERLNKQVKDVGWVYRLPTEVEWEYACRGGPMKDKLESAFDFYFEKASNTLLPDQANFEHGKGLKRTCKVGSYQPNRLGLYDLHGNVWEWCEDELPQPKGASQRASRGGCWFHDSAHCWAAYLNAYAPSNHYADLGLRLARVPIGKEIVKSIAPEEKKPTVETKLPPAFKNTLGMEFVLVPKGKSWLGGEGGRPGDTEVEVLTDFYLGKYEVTQQEWEKVTGQNPSKFQVVADISSEEQRRLPVEQVSWDDCQLFVERLNEQVKDTGWVYRLPAEAEWEYACRNGPMTNKFDSTFGYYFEQPTNMLLPEQANCDHARALKRTRKVGSYPPNKLGLHDMHGNVWEWCADGVKDEKGALRRVHRGGSWDNFPCTAMAHSTLLASQRYLNLGLRLARVPIGKEIVRVVAPEKKPAVEAKLSPTFKNTIGMEFVLVPRGKSWLGGGGGSPGDMEVEVLHDFYLGKYELTQQEWEDVTGRNPSWFSRTGAAEVKDISADELKRFPVENVSWDDAQLFLSRLNAREKDTNWVYRLPKEAEWEYACRGGPLTNKLDSAFDYYFDKPTNLLLPGQANFEHDKSPKRTCKVGSYKPNQLGLFDMHGNVWEWCDSSEIAPAESTRVIRSGSWHNTARSCLAASRFTQHPASIRTDHLGLRLARVPVGKEISRFVVAPRQKSATDSNDPHRELAEWVLKQGADNSVKLHVLGLVKSLAALPSAPFKLRAVQLWTIDTRPGVLDEFTALIGKLPDSLEELTIMPSDDRLLDRLTKLPALKECESLSINSGGVTDAALTSLKRLRLLRYLWAPHTGFTREGLKDLRDNFFIKGMSIGSHPSPLTDTDLAYLPSTLDHLVINGQNFTDAAIDHITVLKEVGWLDLGDTAISDAGLIKLLERKPNLISLHLAKTKVTEKILPRLAEMKFLQQLNLEHLPIGDEGLKTLRSMKQLRWLNVRETKATEGGVRALRAALPTCEIVSSFENVKTIAPEDRKPSFKNSLGMEFVLVPKGKSWLDGGGGKPGDTEVEVLNDFYLGKYEVTQEEWERVTRANPSKFQAVVGISSEEQKRFPVESVSWGDCQAFLDRLNKQVKEPGWVYRLPTETEWEYACRGGAMPDKFDSAFDFYFEKRSNTLLPDQANFEHGKGLKRTCKVGSYQPNRLGLYDMHGNVWEWCADELKDDKGASRRVDRGGSWGGDSGVCRAANRSSSPPYGRADYLGLRVARVPVGKKIVRISAPDKK